ncbi:MAG: L,D-transpeptidase family protein [Desulfuromonadales bacterium]
MRISFFFFFCSSLFLAATTAQGWYPRPEGESFLVGQSPAPVIGKNQRYFLDDGDNLIKVARYMGLGYLGLVQANPGIDPWRPPAGQPIVLPYASILTSPPRPGITINLAEHRLYLIWESNGLYKVRIYPVGIGKQGTETPEGEFGIIQRVSRPTWRVPESVRAEQPDKPAFIPPGPDNPLGDYWLRFTPRGHGIHGTNKPYGIGRRVSHGCIRLYPEDIKDLFGKVKLGTPVRVVYQPAKVGIRDDTLWLEIHPDYLERFSREDLIVEIEKQVDDLNWPYSINRKTLRGALDQQQGFPVPISRSPPAGRIGKDRQPGPRERS